MATEAQPTVGGELAKLVTYVVQLRSDEVTNWQGEPCAVWRDITTVAVPPRTKRQTVIKKALEQVESRMTPIAEAPPVVRVLGPEDARAFKVSAVVRDPELRIEGA
jgi:hypothetical protein